MSKGYLHMNDILADDQPVAYTADLEFKMETPLSMQASRCLDIAGQALTLFIDRNRGYGNTAYNLGAKGQFADMNRKMGKLHHTLWDGNEPVGESIEEMLFDMIGHCLLTIDFLRSEKSK